MTSMTFRKRLLASSSALQALTLLGAGVAATAVAVAPAHAQDYTNVTASGRVIDASGAPVPGATVKVTSDAQGFSNTVTADSSGTYRIPALPQGNYTFEITAPGFATYREPGVSLTQSSAGNNFQLVTEGSTATASDDGEAIVVTGTRIRVSDFDRTTTGAVIPIGELAGRVPVARDLTSVVLLAPGTGQGDTAFGNLAAVSGSSVSENAFFLNGLNITEFREGLGAVGVPFEFYNTIEVKNGGIPAEFGRFTGGFINATTKSGSNELHAGALFNFEPNGLREDAPNSIGGTGLRTGDNSQDYNETKQAIFSLSGPIIKDRVFFYAMYQSNDVRTGDTLLTSNFNTTTPYSTGLRREERRMRSPFYGGKLDIIPIDGHRFEITAFDSRQKTRIDNFAVRDQDGNAYDSRVDTGTTMGPYQNTLVLSAGGINYIGRYTGQITDFLTVSGAYGKNENQDITGSTNDAYPFISDSSGAFNPALNGNALNAIDDNSDERVFYRADVDLFVSAFGQHHFKAGYDKEKLKTNSATRYTGGVAWTYFNSGTGGDVYAPPNTLYVAGRTFVNGGTFESENEAFYIQDAWSLFDNRLNLNLGLRNDRFSNDNVAGETYYESGNAWAPRLSASFDPFGDSLTKVYGSYGRYYLPVVANTNIRLAGAELDYTRYFRVNGVNPDNTPILGAPLLGFADAAACPDTGVLNCDITSDGAATPTEATVAKGLKPQSVDEFVLGIERSLGGRMRVGLFGQYRKLNQSLEDVAIDAAVLKYCAAQNIAGCDDTWTGFHQYVLVNPGQDARITLSDPVGNETTLRTIDFSAADLGYPKARRTYKAVTATFDRDFDGVWGLNASYTWSKSKGNIEGGIRSDNGQTDSGLTTAFDQPGLVDGAYGYLPGDARHRFKLYGSIAPTDWFTFGAQFQASSPRKFGCLGRVPVQRDAFAGAYGAAGFYCNTDAQGKVITDPTFAPINTATNTTLKITPRGSQFKSDWLMFTNLSAAFKIPSDDIGATFRVDVFNVFNQQNSLDHEERGTQSNGRPRSDYGLPLVYQTPRYFRFQLGIDF